MKYDEYMDKECIPICDALNELPDVRTFESCCGHLKRRYVVYLYTDNPYSMAVIARAFDRRYLPTKILWETTIETIDVERTPQFCIGIYSKEAFDDYDTMMHDVNEVVKSINYFSQTEFYDHFKFNKYNKGMREELEKFHPLKYKGKLTQASYDLFEEIEETLYNQDLKEDDIVWSIHYKITTMMEICNPALDDYKWLKEMLECIEKK